MRGKFIGRPAVRSSRRCIRDDQIHRRCAGCIDIKALDLGGPRFDRGDSSEPLIDIDVVVLAEIASYRWRRHTRYPAGFDGRGSSSGLN